MLPTTKEVLFSVVSVHQSVILSTKEGPMWPLPTMLWMMQEPPSRQRHLVAITWDLFKLFTSGPIPPPKRWYMVVIEAKSSLAGSTHTTGMLSCISFVFVYFVFSFLCYTLIFLGSSIYWEEFFCVLVPLGYPPFFTKFVPIWLAHASHTK